MNLALLCFDRVMGLINRYSRTSQLNIILNSQHHFLSSQSLNKFCFLILFQFLSLHREFGVVLNFSTKKSNFSKNPWGRPGFTKIPTSSSLIHGSTSMMILEDIRGETNTEASFFAPTSDTELGNDNEDYGGSLYEYERKRRLSPDQVRSLEKSFEADNKLEPDRKVQLAKQLNLQPRQVAIWFQNRRARCKTKHIEKEYDALKASYEKLKADYDTLHEENESLKNEVHLLTDRLLKKPKLDVSVPDGTNSAKSAVFDPDSPHYTDGLVPADSSHVFEPTDHSDFSQDEDDSLSRSLLSSTCFPKLELENYDDLQPNSCNFGFPIQDQGTWFWSY